MKSTGRKYSNHYEQRQASLQNLMLAQGSALFSPGILHSESYVAGSFSA